MLKFSAAGAVHVCDRGIPRRDFLQVGVMAPLGLALPQLAAANALGQANDSKNCIMIFNLGAPSQIDLFDPKPDAPAEIRGPFKTIPTASKDIRLTELLPKHALLADQFSLVRSCFHTAGSSDRLATTNTTAMAAATTKPMRRASP